MWEQASRKKAQKCAPPNSIEAQYSFLSEAHSAARREMAIVMLCGIRSGALSRASWVRGPRRAMREAWNRAVPASGRREGYNRGWA